jgi:NTP pyrophosphatase (non-canonical NTP hydrolase)
MKNLEDLKAEVLKFALDREWGQFHNPKNLATSIAVEAAELQEVFMWLTPDESQNLSDEQKSRVADEVGDVMICLVNFAASVGIDPLASAFSKLNKNHAKYPLDKARGSAKKYTDF